MKGWTTPPGVVRSSRRTSTAWNPLPSRLTMSSEEYRATRSIPNSAWAVLGKRRHDQGTSASIPDARSSTYRLRSASWVEEVEHRPVVPQPKPSRRPPGEEVLVQPCHGRTRAHTSTPFLKRRFGNVEHRDVCESQVSKVVDKRRRTPADVDHGRVGSDSKSLDQLQRQGGSGWNQLTPATPRSR